jgi:hypothetical protein
VAVFLGAVREDVDPGRPLGGDIRVLFLTTVRSFILGGNVGGQKPE